MCDSNQEPRPGQLSRPEIHVPKFIPYGDGLDRFGNATRSQGLVIDPGLLPRDVPSVPAVNRGHDGQSPQDSSISGPHSGFSWTIAHTSLPDAPYPDSLDQRPSSNRHSPDFKHSPSPRMSTRTPTHRPVASYASPVNGPASFGSPVLSDAPVHEGHRPRVGEDPSGTAGDQGYGELPPQDKESDLEPFAAGAFLLVREGVAIGTADSHDISFDYNPLLDEAAKRSIPREADGHQRKPNGTFVSKAVSKKPLSGAGSPVTRRAAWSRMTPGNPTDARVESLRLSRGPSESPGAAATRSSTPRVSSPQAVADSSRTSSRTRPATPDSTDSDSKSISSPCPAARSDGEEEPMPPHLRQVLRQMLTEFRRLDINQAPAETDLSDTTDQKTSCLPLSPRAPATASKSSNLKRRWTADDGSGSEDRDSPRPRKARKLGNEGTLALACPFWKKNPTTHQACGYISLQSIRDVRQHLRSRHTPEFYCERCYTVFQTEASHQVHILRASCVRLPSSQLDGVSHAKDRALRAKRHSASTGEQQWLAVWTTLFPGLERPRSVFVDPELSAELALFHEHWQTRGHDTLLSVLGESQLRSVPSEEREVGLRKVLDVGFETIHGRWLSDHGAPSLPPTPGGYSATPAVIGSSTSGPKPD